MYISRGDNNKQHNMGVHATLIVTVHVRVLQCVCCSLFGLQRLCCSVCVAECVVARVDTFNQHTTQHERTCNTHSRCSCACVAVCVLQCVCCSVCVAACVVARVDTFNEHTTQHNMSVHATLTVAVQKHVLQCVPQCVCCSVCVAQRVVTIFSGRTLQYEHTCNTCN